MSISGVIGFSWSSAKINTLGIWTNVRCTGTKLGVSATIQSQSKTLLQFRSLNHAATRERMSLSTVTDSNEDRIRNGQLQGFELMFKADGQKKQKDLQKYADSLVQHLFRYHMVALLGIPLQTKIYLSFELCLEKTSI